MAKSPDFTPLDYAVNGNLKQILSERKATTIKGLTSVINEVCRDYNITTIRNSLSCWQSRVQLLIDRQGDHVEVK